MRPSASPAAPSQARIASVAQNVAVTALHVYEHLRSDANVAHEFV